MITKTPIVIVDYGMGNLRSVQKALGAAGAKAIVSDSGNTIAAAEKLVLPGVGAFGDCMANLKKSDLVGPIRDFIATGKPFLGICLGMQLLFEESEEAPGVNGLGIIPGKVVRFSPIKGLKIPHMGWNRVHHQGTTPSPLSKVPDQTFFYFVHSYHVVPKHRHVIAAQTSYGDSIVSAVCQDNLFATQFHPEKSQKAGLQLLDAFLKWKPGRKS